MRTRSIRIRHPAQSGMAYVATLGVILIATILGLAFLAAVGTQTAISEGRNGAMQSQYLAESAVHHALWRFQNEPGFPAAEDVYYVEDLPAGRYGYKMRPPTPTTFATVATVGVVGDHIARQSYVPYIQPTDLLLAYGQEDDTNPGFRRLFGANWSKRADTVDILAEPVYWMELEGSPVRQEAIMATLDVNNDIRLAVWDGGSWGNGRTFTTTANKNYKVFDVAYESLSGNALVVGRYDWSDLVRFNCWNGLFWEYAFPQPAFFHGNSESLTNVVMDSNPRTNGILIGTVCYDYNLEVHYWDGSTFAHLGQLDRDTKTEGFGCLEILHEQQSGDSMIVWARWQSSTVHYAILRGASVLEVGQLPPFGADIRIIRAAADPASDHIFLAAVLGNHELHTAIWDGNAWIDSALPDPGINLNDRQSFDVAWESSGGQAMLVWGPSLGKNIPRYITWQPGTALADCVPQGAPDCTSEIRLVKLSPVSGNDGLLLAVMNTDQELVYSLWTGSRFHGAGAVLLDSAIEMDSTMPFDICEAMVEGVVVNSAPLVSAGGDQMITVDESAILDGEVSDDGLPGLPASLSWAWSVVSGPGVVTFDDPAQQDTTATFSRGGGYVLRLTADDGELIAYDDVTIAVTAYIESFQPWSLGTASAWTVFDLSTSPFDVPPNAVLEVAITNSESTAEWSGGVRAVGSALERRLSLHEAESGGVDAMVMHVQADAGARIECYAENASAIGFTLLGYWIQGTYVETWSSFQAGSSDWWLDHPLATYGVGPGEVAEITVVNTASTYELTAGVRTNGSSVSSRGFRLHEAEGGGNDAVTLFVTAGSDANSTIELWVQSHSSIEYFLTGYWSDPPGTYIEAGDDLGLASTNGSWETLGLSSFGVPVAAVVQIGLSNQRDGSQNHIGVRQIGSVLQRSLDLHEAEAGGEDLGTMHVHTGLGASIERYHEDVSDEHRFYLYGWWE